METTGFPSYTVKGFTFKLLFGTGLSRLGNMEVERRILTKRSLNLNMRQIDFSMNGCYVVVLKIAHNCRAAPFIGAL